jgi:phospholipid/cholesterol/gamma-HCH transport system substrate-binding protein
METRANYVLIGAFTLLAVLAALGFAVWLARVEFDRQFEYYDILFDNVSGLTRGGEVRFNGVTVGQVLSFDFDREDPTLVRVRIEVRADTPVTADVDARLQLQGVTGVSFVSLTTTDANAPLLRDTSDQPIPTIRARPSPLDTLLAEAPDLLSEAVLLIREMRDFAGQENQDAVARILTNVSRASGRLESALDDFSQVSSRIADATEVLSRFTENLAPVAENLGPIVEDAQAALVAATTALGEAETALTSVNGFMNTRMPVLADTAETTLEDVASAARELSERYGAAADAATARFQQVEAAIARSEEALGQATTTLAAVERAAASVDTLVAGDGTALVAETRVAVSTAQATLERARSLATDDLPAIAADIRAATETVNRVAAQVGEDISQAGADLSRFTGRLDGLATAGETTLAAATETFRSANTTLTAIDQALFTAERTLTVAEQTFLGANRVIDEDLGPIFADVGAAARELEATMAAVSGDLPAITADLRTAVEAAGRAMEGLEAAVAGASPQVQAFAASGLPQFTRLMQEARALVTNLDRLTQRIERDPARFFLGSSASEYRR